ncbi:MAG: hypothetical protein ACJA2G_003074 [Cognaticolwellia sp.]
MESARLYAKQAVEINSTSTESSDTYAWIIAQQGDYDLAFILTKLERNKEALTVLRKNLDNTSIFSERVQAEKLFQCLTQATSQS